MDVLEIVCHCSVFVLLTALLLGLFYAAFELYRDKNLYINTVLFVSLSTHLFFILIITLNRIVL